MNEKELPFFLANSHFDFSRVVECAINFQSCHHSFAMWNSHFTVLFRGMSNGYCVVWQFKLWTLPLRISAISPCGICSAIHKRKHLFIVLFENIIHHFWQHIYFMLVSECVWMDIMRLRYHHSNQNPSHSFCPLRRSVQVYFRSITTSIADHPIHSIIGFIVFVRSKIKL